MDGDWTLLEYRPGRYVKVSPTGEVLGKASEAEVLAWFSTRREESPPDEHRAAPTAGDPAPTPNRRLIRSPSGAEIWGRPHNEARPANAPPGPKPAPRSTRVEIWGRPRNEPQPQSQSTRPQPASRPTGVEVWGRARTEPESSVRSEERPPSDGGSSAEAAAGDAWEGTGDIGSRAPGSVVAVGADAPPPGPADQEGWEERLTAGAEQAPPRAGIPATEVLVSPVAEQAPPSAGMPATEVLFAPVTEEVPTAPVLAVPVASSGVEVPSTPTAIVSDERPAALESEPVAPAPHSARSAPRQSEVLSAIVRDEQEAETVAEAAATAGVAELLYEFVGDDEDLASVLEIESATPGDVADEGRPEEDETVEGEAPVPIPEPAAPLGWQEDGDGHDRWLWLDARGVGAFGTDAFDLAGFLQQGTARFQAKPWVQGQAPGRLMVHPSLVADDLVRTAEAFGLTVVTNPRVAMGIYCLGLAEDR